MAQAEVLLKILSDGKYHSGEELGQQFSVSRAAIWKAIQKIEQQYAVNIYAVKGKGYRLPGELDLLDKESIMSSLSNSTLNKLHELEILHAVDSTNHYLNNKSVDGASSGYIVLAEQQSKGQGRRGKAWISPFASNVYLSLLWRFPFGPAQLSCLSLFIAVAVVRSLKRLGLDDVGVKWPNDIYYKNKKIAGILLEMRGDLSGPCAVVIGVGVNVSMPKNNKEVNMIDQPWSDIESILQQKIQRNTVTTFIIDDLFKVLSQIPENNSLLLDEWQSLDVLKDQHVEVISQEKILTGICKGINKDGALRVQHGNKEKFYHSGEVSLRRE